MTDWKEELLQKLDAKLEAECTRLTGRIPYWTKDGVYQQDYAEKDINWWTNGFWAGLLWQMYHATAKPLYRERAENVEKLLDKALYGFMGLHHDTGFMWLHSAVADYRLTGNPQSRVRGLMAANILAGRFNPTGQYIRAWNPESVEPGEDCTGWIIVDSMMNIPLLYWASEELHDPRFAHIAQAHADTVRRTLVREDGSCGHIACIDPDTGELTRVLAGQGYSDTSSWSRGQSWILYGFALSYRHTGRQEYLDTAKRTANYFLANISMTDHIARCDFRQPAQPDYLDTSASLCAACGLLEIARHVDAAEAAMYKAHAEQIIRSTVEHHCNWDPARDSIVQDCKVAYHGCEDQTDLIYADYFLTEAVLRLLGKDFLIW